MESHQDIHSSKSERTLSVEHDDVEEDRKDQQDIDESQKNSRGCKAGEGTHIGTNNKGGPQRNYSIDTNEKDDGTSMGPNERTSDIEKLSVSSDIQDSKSEAGSEKSYRGGRNRRGRNKGVPHSGYSEGRLQRNDGGHFSANENFNQTRVEKLSVSSDIQDSKSEAGSEKSYRGGRNRKGRNRGVPHSGYSEGRLQRNDGGNFSANENFNQTRVEKLSACSDIQDSKSEAGSEKSYRGGRNRRGRNRGVPHSGYSEGRLQRNDGGNFSANENFNQTRIEKLSVSSDFQDSKSEAGSEKSYRGGRNRRGRNRGVPHRGYSEGRPQRNDGGILGMEKDYKQSNFQNSGVGSIEKSYTGDHSGSYHSGASKGIPFGADNSQAGKHQSLGLVHFSSTSQLKEHSVSLVEMAKNFCTQCYAIIRGCLHRDVSAYVGSDAAITFFGPAVFGVAFAPSETLHCYLGRSHFEFDSSDYRDFCSGNLEPVGSNIELFTNGNVKHPFKKRTELKNDANGRLWHLPTGLPLHITNNPSLCMTANLIRMYCFWSNVKLVMVIIREWWLLNIPDGERQLGDVNFPVEWLILFYLMDTEVKYVPTVHGLGNHGSSYFSTQFVGQEFLTNLKEMKYLTLAHTFLKKDPLLLVIGFFCFYRKMNCVNSIILDVMTGKFSEAESKGVPLVMRQPFDQSINLLSSIDKHTFQTFKAKTAATLRAMAA